MRTVLLCAPWLALAPLAVLLAPASAGAAAPASGALACEVDMRPGDQAGFRCVLPASAQRYRFSATFSGSHDDTRASLGVRLDGAPVPCEEGSKTRTSSEDGEVTLDCAFRTPANAATTHVLQVELKWHHAQYESHALRAE